MSSCHTPSQFFQGPTDLTIALAGNPNVGKSSIFNRLTGAHTETANYPGKTVALNYGVTRFEGKRIGLVDLPGTYALGALSEDQWVARQAVLDTPPDAVVAIVDATNLERNLYLVLQFLDLGLPLVLAVNLIDQATRSGIRIDTVRLADALHVPALPTVATRGEGIADVLSAASQLRPGNNASLPVYDPLTESAVQTLSGFISDHLQESPYHLQPRALALLLLEEDAGISSAVESLAGGALVLEQARDLAEQIKLETGEPSGIHIPRARHTVARAIALEVQSIAGGREPLSVRLWRKSIEPLTGVPALIIVLVGLFAFLFIVGGTLSQVMANLWAAWVSGLQAIALAIFGKGLVSKVVLWGFDSGIEAALEVGVPYVLTFYAVLAVLEDSGYMNSMAFMLDSLMKRLGLHGRAAILLLAGAGCNVPAIMGTRVLTTRRERIIASTLIVLTPCSARTAVIIGGAALFAGWQYGAVLFLISLGLLVLVGMGLNWVMPGRSDDLVMEMFPFRIPAPSAVIRKTWHRFKEYVVMALPIVLIGSMVMGGLYETGWIWALSAPMAPLVEGWLGLPSVAGLTLLFAILRKELALQFLVTLALVQYGSGAHNLLAFMTPQQLFVYALVNTIYIPCLATFTMLSKELGPKIALAIGAFTVALALLVGGIAHYALALV